MRVQFFRKRFQQFFFSRRVAAVADDTRQPYRTAGGKPPDAFGNVVGGIQTHEFAGRNDVNFFCIAFPDGHGETAADYVSQYIVEGNVHRRDGFQFIQQLQGYDDAPTRAAHTGLRAARFHTGDAVVTGVNDILCFYAVYV